MSFTTTQSRILRLLSDGRPHAREELRRLLSDDLSGFNNLQAHVSRLRKRLLLRGETVVCELHRGTIHYRHVRLVSQV